MTGCLVGILCAVLTLFISGLSKKEYVFSVPETEEYIPKKVNKEKSEEIEAPVDSYEVLEAPTQDEQVENSSSPMDESKETSDNDPSQAPENGNLPEEKNATNPTVKPCYPSE